MANVGKNNGRVLRQALRRFAATLIREARDVSGISSYTKLDDALGLQHGTSHRYSLYPLERANTRAPQAAAIQGLENRVAKLLRRPPHKVIIENTKPLTEVEDGIEYLYHALNLKMDEPREKANYRDADPSYLELGYEFDWPTYDRLGTIDLSNLHDQDKLVNMYAWQWGILWDRGILPEPWNRETIGIHPNVPIEDFIFLHRHRLAIDRYYTHAQNLLRQVAPEALPEFRRNVTDSISNFQQSPAMKSIV